MLRIVIALAIVLALGLVLLRRTTEQSPVIPKDVAGEIKAVPLMEAPKQVQADMKRIQEQSRAKIEKTMRESESP
jgi:hypothetical protein